MASEHRERVRIWRNGHEERKQRVVESQPALWSIFSARLSQLVWLFAGLIVIVIGFRVVLMMVAANAANLFAQFIYNLSWWFVAPFSGLVAAPPLANGGTFEISSLIAMLVYIILAFVIDRLLDILLAGWGRRRSVTTIERENHPE